MFLFHMKGFKIYGNEMEKQRDHQDNQNQKHQRKGRDFDVEKKNMEITPTKWWSILE